MNKYTKLFSNTIVFAFSSVLSKIVLSLMLPLYTRVLTTTEYGIAELLTTIVQLAVPICSVAISEAVFRYSMQKNISANNVLKSACIVLIWAIGGLGIVSIFLRLYPALSEFCFYFFLISVSTMLRTVLSLYLKATDRAMLFSVDNILYNTLLALFNIVFLVFFDMALNGYFFAMFLANVVSMTFMISKGRIWSELIKANADRALIREMVRYSLPLVLNAISWGMMHLIDKVMLDIYVSSSAMGVYSAASKVPSILSLITGVISQAWTISAIQDYENDQDKEFFTNIFVLLHLGTTVFSLCIFTVNNWLLKVVFGSEFIDAISYVPILIIGSVFLAYSNFYTPIYSAVKNSKQIMSSAFLGMLINICLNALLIPHNGVMGACVATAVSYAFIALFRMINSRQYFRFKIFRLKWCISLLVVIIGAISVIFDWYSIRVNLVGIITILLIYKKPIILMLCNKSAVK